MPPKFRIFVTLAAGLLAVAQVSADQLRRQWVQTYSNQTTSLPSNDIGLAVAVDQNGNVVVTGVSNSDDGGSDIYTAKYAANDGRLLWQVRRSADSAQYFGDSGVAVKVDSAGDVLVAGNSSGYYAAKYAGSDGHIIWETRYVDPSGSGPQYVRGVAMDKSGNLIIAGDIGSEIGVDPLGGGNVFLNDLLTVKFAAADGHVVWVRRYDDARRQHDTAHAVAVDDEGNVSVGGETTETDTSTDLYVAKYAAADGRTLWEHKYTNGDRNYERVYAMTTDASGNVLVTGKSAYNLYSAKYAAATGATIWEKLLTGPSESEGRGIAVDASGNAIICGHSTASSRTSFYVAKLHASTGDTMWEQRHGLDGASEALQVLVDKNGDVFASGYDSPNEVRNTDLYTAKLSGTTGAFRWEGTYDSPAHSDENPAITPIALTINGGVALVGGSRPGAYSQDSDFVTVNYSPTGQSLNISTRMKVGTDTNVMIGGFIVTGSQPKTVLIRAIGPSLGIPGALANPFLEVHTSDGKVIKNDDWKVGYETQPSQRAEIEATTIPPANDKEAALIATLPPGAHTAIVSGVAGGTGIGLVEVYDLASGNPSAMANISTRGFVDVDDNVLIGGFILGGSSSNAASSKIVVRALGPSLKDPPANIANALNDPELKIYNSNGAIVVLNGQQQSNDNWQQLSQADQAELAKYGIAPTRAAESALIPTLPPGNYTAVVRGVNRTTGVGQVEIYNLP